MNSVARYTRDRQTVDRHAAALAALLLVVQGGAVWLAGALHTAGYQPDTPVGGAESSAAESAGVGAAWVGLEVAFAVALLGLILVYQKLPAWLQKTIRLNMGIGVVLYIGGYWANLGILPAGIVFTLGALTIYKVADHYGLWWVINNIAAVAIAILAGAAIAFVLGVWGMLVGLLGLTIYDHIFANKREWMFDMIEVMLKARLPMLVFRPPTWRYEWSRLWEDEIDGDDADDSTWGIGMADLALPAGFASAVAVAPTQGLVSGGTLAATAVIVGVSLSAFRLRHEMLTKGAGAGMPAITAGAFGSFAIVQVAGVVAGLAAVV